MSTFFKWFSEIHSTSQCLFFEIAVDFTISLYYNKNVGSPFSAKFSFQNQFAGDFLIIKVFLKNVVKLIESYICCRLFFSKVEGCRLKRNSGAGVFL